MRTLEQVWTSRVHQLLRTQQQETFLLLIPPKKIIATHDLLKASFITQEVGYKHNFAILALFPFSPALLNTRIVCYHRLYMYAQSMTFLLLSILSTIHL